jgi:type I restriction enzyme R subunit
MSKIGEAERKTQKRVAKLFVDELGYEHLGDLSDGDNRNVIESQLEHFLMAYQGYAERPDGEDLVRRAIAELKKEADNTGVSLYDRNREVYRVLRYGAQVKAAVGEQTETVWLIDWKHPERNRFAIAEEVTVKGANAKAATKRPDLVLYVNGIALGVLELKRSTVSVSEGIRQNLDNQKKEFIEPFFSTMQYVMAGNDAEGLRYGTIETPEKYYLTWKEPGGGDNRSTAGCGSCATRRGCWSCPRLHGVRRGHEEAVPPQPVLRRACGAGPRAAARRRHHLAHAGLGQEPDDGVAGQVDSRERDRRAGAGHHRPHRARRADREGVPGRNETIKRTTSGADLIAALLAATPWLICSLVHKFGGKEGGESVGDISKFVADLKKSLPADFKPRVTSTCSSMSATAPSRATCTTP